jgi:hypothetical protein
VLLYLVYGDKVNLDVFILVHLFQRSAKIDDLSFFQAFAEVGIFFGDFMVILFSPEGFYTFYYLSCGE